MSKSAALTLTQETGLSVSDVSAKADVVHRAADVGASIASGSFRTLGMLIAPCSVRTMSEIATGVTSSLLTRAADVVLKERRTLVLMVRETPFHLGHLRTMTSLAEMGAVIAPPLPAFYAKPASIEEMVDQSVGRVLDLFGLSWRPVKRWGEDLETITGKSEG
ncbi:4-hydroxy-3-polyprenylbenzoate decarboxylase [Caulobacter sp. BE264]|nr:4-hydroxy-3-polyprenylbenzoate decarboxylase [Caulobacter sp. BE264]